jgi:hypothetical protein
MLDPFNNDKKSIKVKVKNPPLPPSSRNSSQMKKPYTKQDAANAETIRRWKVGKDAQCVVANGPGWIYNTITGQCQLA